MEFFVFVMLLALGIFWIVIALVAVTSLGRIANALEHIAGLSKVKDESKEGVEDKEGEWKEEDGWDEEDESADEKKEKDR